MSKLDCVPDYGLDWTGLDWSELSLIEMVLIKQLLTGSQRYNQSSSSLSFVASFLKFQKVKGHIQFIIAASTIVIHDRNIPIEF